MFKIDEKGVKHVSRSATRASGRKRAKGADKAAHKLEQRRLAYGRLYGMTQVGMKEPGSMQTKR